MTKYIKKIIPLLIILTNSAIAIYGQTYNNKTYLEARYIESFTHFIEWPYETTIDSNNFVIGIFGKNEITPVLVKIINNKKIDGKNVIIKEINNIEEAKRVHIIFIPNNPPIELNEILRSLKILPVLSISNARNAAKTGIHIGLYVNNNKMRFKINYTTFKKTNLKMEYKLIELADEVYYP